MLACEPRAGGKTLGNGRPGNARSVVVGVGDDLAMTSPVGQLAAFAYLGRRGLGRGTGPAPQGPRKDGRSGAPLGTDPCSSTGSLRRRRR